jgi:periplasmic divalent cation tolerance protein
MQGAKCNWKSTNRSCFVEMDALVVFATVPEHATGVKISEHLVDNALAACVHILPAGTSTYRWQGQRETAVEHTLLIKTVSARFQELQQAICRLHPYECPEIIAISVADGLPSYLDWISATTAPAIGVANEPTRSND